MENEVRERSLDYLLAHLPYEPASPELAVRIYQHIQSRRRRWSRARLVMSTILAVSGIWLVVQDLREWVMSTSMPNTNLIRTLEWLELSMSGVETAYLNALDGYNSLQSMLTPLGIAAWPGLIALALSALLLIDFLLPHKERS
jgi:hypothetical protein